VWKTSAAAQLVQWVVFHLLPIESSAKKIVKRREGFGWILKEFGELLHLKWRCIGLTYFSASKKGW
jgi:hypothetical protein